MKRIIISLSIIVAAAAIAIGATTSFFSDTETSTGNTFTAGDIDLQIDNESYATDNTILGFPNPTGVLAFSTSTSWDLKDLVPGVDHFFNFHDLKPGDMGEDTISIHVGSNDAWMCAAAQITDDNDNGITEPEDESALPAGDGSDGTDNDGDLDSALNFVFWNDDGDNVYEPRCNTPLCVPEIIFLEGPLSGIGAQGKITLADSGGSILPGGGPIPGDDTFYIGKAWCFGDIATPGLDQDGFGKTSGPAGVNPSSTNGPIERPEGVTCDGSNEGNIAQTDSVVGDMQFYAEQSRNNSNFDCAQNYIPSWAN